MFGAYHALALLAVTFVVTFALVPAVKHLAWRLDAVDYPSKRRVNSAAVPRLGGLAMFGGMAAAFLFECLGEALLGWNGLFLSQGHLPINYLVVMFGVLVMLAVATVDDIWQIHWWQKLLGQVVAALLICIGGVQFAQIQNPFVSGPDFIEFGLWTYLLTVVYIVGFVNMMNLIDGLDGLAAGVTAIVGIALFVIAYGKARAEAAMMAVVLVGACLAFLRYNFAPAKIYMGDVGSHLLGTMLAIISLVGVMRSPTFIVLIVPLIIAGIPFVDTLLSIIRRIRHHQPVTRPDMRHFHHLLIKRNWTTPQAVLIVWGLTALLALAGILMASTTGFIALFIFIALLVVFGIILWRLGLFGDVWTHYYNPRGRNKKK
ncbi:MAG: undecaprenyl/decaprenyl-phosphate alpha-N-acetylglucosaminyl 1-phosphate transferase [Coriobacteriales bacterium]|jgi:UDP-GlcNAc:undecaprenyl-phosphate GlcNAc-1-phosphate transferase|nr:undecaprenyl/decaprenyl-phosphate alpha-N-acetylglucosaminyl 1-phosphate transferase [Coriobacteriales bacterium]